MDKKDKKVTIIGSGIIGSCWALVFAKGGLNVVLFDTVEEQLKKALESIEEKLKALKTFELLKEDIETIKNRVTTSTVLEEALKDSIYVQECVPEKLEIKKQVFEKLESLVSPSTILASSTSGIPSSQFTSHLKTKERCIVSHPINPPHLMKLVELVPAPYTSKEVLAQTKQLLESVGQIPITLKKEIPGFVQPRLQYAITAEAFRLVEDGVVSAEDIDKTVIHGLVARWSFLGLFGCWDLNANGMKDYANRYFGNFYGCCKSMDNTREFSKETIEQVDSEMRKSAPLSELPTHWAHRDERLMFYSKHVEDAKKIDKKFFNKEPKKE